LREAGIKRILIVHPKQDVSIFSVSHEAALKDALSQSWEDWQTKGAEVILLNEIASAFQKISIT
jgi:hypothetical protein